MTTERITIEQWAAMYPHGIKARLSNIGRFNLDSEHPNEHAFKTGTITSMYFNEDGSISGVLRITERYSFDFDNIDEIEIFLRPLSSLTKEITHNGETFVPIEWFEIGDDNNDSLEYDNGNIKLVKQLESIAKHEIVNDIQYLPYAVVQKLLEWKFDTWGLINKNLAVEYEH